MLPRADVAFDVPLLPYWLAASAIACAAACAALLINRPVGGPGKARVRTTWALGVAALLLFGVARFTVPW